MKKNGFTLVELLAVFILLGLIALITIPSLTVVKERSQEKSFLASARGILESINLKYSQNEIEKKEFLITDPKLNLKNQSQYVSGYINYDTTKNKFKLDRVSDGKYCANGVLDEITVKKGTCSQPEGCFTFSNSVITAYDVDANGCGTNVIIPKTINGEKVIKIDTSAFSNKQLTAVFIPDSIDIIGGNAFSNNQLVNIVIPSSVTLIKNEAFNGNNLESITFRGIKTNNLGTNWFEGSPLINFIKE